MPTAQKTYQFDCRWFTGFAPCRYHRPCRACNYFEPMGNRILILSLTPSSRVALHTALLPALKRKYPSSYITWLTSQEMASLLTGQPLIDQVLSLDIGSLEVLKTQHFDICLAPDIHPIPASLIQMMNADKKYGFGLNSYGGVFPINSEARYLYHLELKLDTQPPDEEKSYPQLIIEALGLTFEDDQPTLEVDKDKSGQPKAAPKKKNKKSKTTKS